MRKKKTDITKSASIVTNCLIKALSLDETKKKITSELSALLFTDALEHNNEDCKKEILKLTQKYRSMETVYG